MNNKMLHMVTFGLLVIGGLNWLLVAFDYNLVYMILGDWPIVESAVYVLVGLSAIYEILVHKQNCRHCSATAASSDVVHG